MPQYFTKSLASASSAIGSISTAATPIVVLASSSLDTQRRITFSTTTAADFSGVRFTLTGTQEGGNTITETVVGSSVSTTPWSTVQDFLTLTSVAMSTTIPNQPIYIQTSAIGGTPWTPVNTCVVPTNIGFGVTFYTTHAGFAPLSAQIEYSFDNPPGQGLPNSNSSFSRPYPILSTSISTAAITPSAGYCNLPITCWRMTVTSTSTAGTTTTSSAKVYLSVLQSGLGSAL